MQVDNSYKIDQLKDFAKQKGFKGYSKFKKAELIDFINTQLLKDFSNLEINNKWEQLKAEIQDSKNDYESDYELERKNIKDLPEKIITELDSVDYDVNSIFSRIYNYILKQNINNDYKFEISVDAFNIIYRGIIKLFNNLIISKSITDLDPNLKIYLRTLYKTDYFENNLAFLKNESVYNRVQYIINYIIDDLLELSINSVRDDNNKIITYLDIQKVAFNDEVFKDIFKEELIPIQYWSIKAEYLPKKGEQHNKFWRDINILKILDLHGLKSSNHQIDFLKKYTIKNYYTNKCNLDFGDYLHTLILNISDKIKNNITYKDFTNAVMDNTFVKTCKN